MDQEIILYRCTYLQHESQSILGYCLKLNCQKPSQYCELCKKKNQHSFHSDHLFSFQEIKELLIQISNFINAWFQRFASEEQKYQQARDFFHEQSKFILDFQKYLESKDYWILVDKISLLKKWKIFYNSCKKINDLEQMIKQLVNFEQPIIQNKQLIFRPPQQRNQIRFSEKIDYRLKSKLNFKEKIKSSCRSNKNRIHFSTIKVLFQENCFDEALQQIVKTLQQYSLKDWEKQELLMLKGKILLKKGFEEKAIRCFEEIISSSQINQSNLNAFEYKGVALIRLGLNKEALLTFNQILSVEPNNIFSLYQKGILLAKENQLLEALQIIEKCLSYDIHFAEGQCNKGIILHKLGRYLEALNCFELAVYYQPDYLSPIYYKGITLIKLNKLNEAIQCFDTVLNIIPNYYNLLIDKGCLLAHSGDLQNALLCFENAQNLASNNEIALRIILQMMGQHAKAQEFFDKAIQIQPRNFKYLINKAISLQKLNRYEEAIGYYEKFLHSDQNTNNIPALLLKGFNLYKLNSYSEAINCCDKVITLHKLNIFAKQLICVALFKLGRIEVALNLYQLMIQADIKLNYFLEFPKAQTLTECCKCIQQIENNYLEFFIERYYSLSCLECFFEEISCSNAIQIQQEAKFIRLVKQAKDLVFPFNQDNYNEILELYNNALKIKPKDLKALLGKGQALYFLKQYQEAIQCFEEITQINLQDINADRINSSIKANTIIKFQIQIEFLSDLKSVRQIYLKAIYHKSQCLAKIHCYQQSTECLNQYLSLENNDIDGLHKKIWILHEFDKYEEELEIIQIILDLDPLNSIYLLFLKFRALFELQKYNETIQTCQILLEIIPTSLSAREYIIKALIKQKQINLALKYCNEIIVQNPFTPSISILKQQAIFEENPEKYAINLFKQYQSDSEWSKQVKTIKNAGFLYREKLQNLNQPSLYKPRPQNGQIEFILNPLLQFSIQLIEQGRIYEAHYCYEEISLIDRKFRQELSLQQCESEVLILITNVCQTFSMIDPSNKLALEASSLAQNCSFNSNSALTLFEVFIQEEVIEAAEMLLSKIKNEEDKKLKFQKILMKSLRDLVDLLLTKNGELIQNQELFLLVIENCDKILSYESKDYYALLSKSHSLSCLGRYQEAINSLDLILKNNPEDHSAIIAKGQYLYQLNDRASALDFCKLALQLNPRLLGVNSYIAMILFTLDDYENAIVYIEREIEIDPSYAAISFKGDCLLKLNRYHDALNNAEEILNFYPDSASNLILKGKALLNLQLPEQAIECFDQVLTRNEKNFQALLNKGNSLKYLKKYIDALILYDFIIENKLGQFFISYYYKGELLLELKFYDEALEQFKLYLDFNPNDKEAEVYAGNTLLEMGKLQEAIVHFKNAYKLDKKDLLILQKLTTALIQDDNKEEAWQYFYEARIINPNLIEDKQSEWNVIYNQIKEIIISKEKENTDNNHK